MEDSFLTDSEDEQTVEDIISQATDHSVLEQIAKLNSSSFSESLPSNLEQRFRKLKSLPATAAAHSRGPLDKARSFTLRTPETREDFYETKGTDSKRELNFLSNKYSNEMRKLKDVELKSESVSESGTSSDEEHEKKKSSTKSKPRSLSNSRLGKRNNKKSISKLGVSRSDFSHSDVESDEEEVTPAKARSLSNSKVGKEKKSKAKVKFGTSDLSPSDSESDEEKVTKSKPSSLGKQKHSVSKVGTGSFISRSDSSRSDLETDEEKVRTKPRASSNSKVLKQKNSRLKVKKGSGSFISRSNSWMSGCLWCTPKKKGKENRSLSSSSSSIEDLDDDLDFMKSFSMKEQKKIIKKAMKEEEKVNREAEKIVKWAKQYSDKMMNVSGLDGELSDFENNMK